MDRSFYSIFSYMIRQPGEVCTRTGLSRSHSEHHGAILLRVVLTMNVTTGDENTEEGTQPDQSQMSWTSGGISKAPCRAALRRCTPALASSGATGAGACHICSTLKQKHRCDFRGLNASAFLPLCRTDL